LKNRTKVCCQSTSFRTTALYHIFRFFINSR